MASAGGGVEDEPEVIVIDSGSGMLKAGFSGEDAPRVVFPNVVGVPKDAAKRRRAAGETKETFVGSMAQEHRERLAMRNPVVRGRITNFDDMATIWDWTIHTELGIDADAAALPVSGGAGRCETAPAAGRRRAGFSLSRARWPDCDQSPPRCRRRCCSPKCP